VKSHGRESLERWAICGGIRCLDTRQTFGAISSVPPLSHSVKARRVLRLSGSGLRLELSVREAKTGAAVGSIKAPEERAVKEAKRWSLPGCLDRGSRPIA
jgi:hypothetical protein